MRECFWVETLVDGTVYKAPPVHDTDPNYKECLEYAIDMVLGMQYVDGQPTWIIYRNHP